MSRFQFAIYLFVLICIATFSRDVHSQTDDVNKAERFSSPEITRKGQTISFNDYRQWFESVKKEAKRPTMIDRFQRTFDPKEVNRILKNVESHWIEYKSDGLKIAGVIAFPKNVTSEKLPVVIYNRGGNDKHPHNRFSLFTLILPLAEQGYIVLASNYRGARFSEGIDEFGGKDVNDVLRLIELVPTISHADPDRIGMAGWSRGAMMTMLAAKSSQKIKASAVIAGAYNQSEWINTRPGIDKTVFSRLVPAYNENREEALKARSALFWLDELNANMPILIMHGTLDWRVNHKQSILLSEGLTKLAHPHKLRIFDEGDHSLTFYRQDWRDELFDWFEKHL